MNLNKLILFEKINKFFKNPYIPFGLRMDRYLYKAKLYFYHILARGPKEFKVNPRLKNLIAIPVGEFGKEHVKKIINTFGHDDFDYILFIWDDSKYEESIFQSCVRIYEKGFKWYFMKKYINKKLAMNYNYILPWDDDIDIGDDFDVKKLFSIMRRNKLQVAQPALKSHSYFTHKLTLQVPGVIGRFTDYTELMAQIYTRDAWIRFWKFMEKDWNHWGWGYGPLFRKVCRFHRMGIIDACPVHHVKPLSMPKLAAEEGQKFCSQFPREYISRWISYNYLK